MSNIISKMADTLFANTSLPPAAARQWADLLTVVQEIKDEKAQSVIGETSHNARKH